MWKFIRHEAREFLLLTAMVGGLSLLSLGVAFGALTIVESQPEHLTTVGLPAQISPRQFDQ